MDWIYFIILGALAGWLSSSLMGRPSFGCFGNTILGIIGGVVGGYIFNFFNINVSGGFWASLATAVIGAISVLFLANLFSGRR